MTSDINEVVAIGANENLPSTASDSLVSPAGTGVKSAVAANVMQRT